MGTNQVLADAIAGTVGARPDTYNVTIEKVELCRSTACSNPFVLGSVSGTFDIASATAGADIGKLVDISGIPLYQTWTHVRTTLSAQFSMAMSTGACRTNGTDIAARNTAFAGYNNGAAAGNGALQTMYLPNQAVIQTAAGLGAYNYSNNGITQTDDAASFTMITALSSPYTCTGVMPRVEVKLDTSAAFGYVGACANNMTFPQPPTLTITATDP